MKCPDCGGSGKYQPLVGPPENCTLCGGSGNARVGHPASGPINAVWRKLTLCSKNHDGVMAGEWFTWDDDYSKPVDIFQNGVRVRYDGIRMMACDRRNIVNPNDPGDLVFADDEPTRFNKLDDEFRAAVAARNFMDLFVGPRLEFYLPDVDYIGFWHAWSAVSKKLIAGSLISGIRNPPLAPLNIGSSFILNSDKCSHKGHEWFAPTARKVP